MQEIADYEHKIITELSKNSNASQRYLSKVLNLSLGMVNVILRRLIKKGYMKMKQLDGRKVQYILTPKGFSEKIARSKEFVRNTISLVSGMKSAIKNIVMDYYEKGYKNFYFFGDGDLLSIIEAAFRELGYKDIKLKKFPNEEKKVLSSSVVFCLNKMPDNIPNGYEFVDIMQRIAQELE